MVAYLKKPTGSEGFQEIVDFLNGSHIRYALTKNLTIYVSLIEKFWQTATVSTIDNGEQEITATVDDKEFTVTEASVRSHLQLADADGIIVLQNSEIFDQLSLMGELVQVVPRCQESIGGSIAQIRSERVPTPSYYSPLLGVHTPRSDEERFKQHELTGNVQQPSNDPPFSRGHILGSGEDSIELIKKLMETCAKLSERVLALEESKTAQDLVIIRLKLRVKKLEKKKKKARTPQPLKRRLFKGRFDDETDFDAGFYKVQVTPTQTYIRRRRAVSTGSDGISTTSRLFSTAKESVCTAVKDKGKGKMEEYDDEQSKRTKLQQEQDRLGYEAAVRLQEELDEEERQRMDRVHKIVNTFVPMETEVRGRASELAVGSSKRAAEAELNYEGSKRVGNHTKAYQFFDDMLKAFERDNLVMLWSLVKERFSSTEHTDDKERTLWVELKRLFEPDTDDKLWKLQREEFILPSLVGTARVEVSTAGVELVLPV
uniref:Xylulose kinase-1 n=1 Tax=Tanacetum cinerariifolium TaxID=118510 RepID=A0A699GUM4_TANCI|nr:hypothetical protein [Tanacetum cinerariifolium]